MKITRHTAPDMRQAMRQVREQLGPDAVILSTRRGAQGIEITAAMDFDAEAIAMAASLPPQPAAPAPAVMPASPPAAAPDSWVSALSGMTATAQAPLPVLAAAPEAAAVNAGMENELKSLRRMLETQLATLAWKDLEQRAPVHTEMLRELTQMGLDPEFATAVAGQIPPYTDLLQARRLSIAGLAQRIPVTGDNWLDNGGRIALVGPTGVGKSTTLAKLAVRWALRHGNRDLALVGADTARLGAQEQIRSLGQLLGAPVYTPESVDELPALLGRLERFRCVLVDTAGQSQRDAHLGQRLQAIAGSHPALATTLVLSASTQAGAVAETVRRFAPARPASVVLTKLDEAVSLGGLLSVLMRASLPIAYVSEGQRVPEDLRPARSLELVSSAVTLAQMAGATADEDLLKRRFGDIAHAFAS